MIHRYRSPQESHTLRAQDIVSNISRAITVVPMVVVRRYDNEIRAMFNLSTTSKMPLPGSPECIIHSQFGYAARTKAPCAFSFSSATCRSCKSSVFL